MTVKELKIILDKYDDDRRICIQTERGNFYDFTKIEIPNDSRSNNTNAGFLIIKVS